MAVKTRPARKPISDADKAAKAAAYTALMDQLDAFSAEVEAGEISDKKQARIDALSAKYSERNTLLIVMQCPKASEIKGFRAWEAAGRMVRKGEKGIRIFAPAGQADGIEGQAATADTPAVDGKPGRKFFRLIAVFDISQTDVMEVAK